MSNINELKNINDVSFINNLTQDDVYELLKQKYIENYRNITGNDPDLYDTSTVTLLMKSFAFIFAQGLQYVDRAGKQDLLKYSYGSYLDNLAIMRGITRRQATASHTTLEFTLVSVQKQTIVIPQGTRVKSRSTGLYFATTQYAEIPIGQFNIYIPADCTTIGNAGNNLAIGDISILVDTTGMAFIQNVSNTVVSSGGADIESDDSLTLRVYEVGKSFSVAGPVGAYEFYTRSSRPDILDVFVDSPSPGEVHIYVQLQDNSILNQQILDEIKTYLDKDKIRPLTDHITVSAPSYVEYDIKLSYWINSADSTKVKTIQKNIDNAIAQYILWQNRLGKDINPSELTRIIMNTGVKRIEIQSPARIVVKYNELPKLVDSFNISNIVYKGLEEE